MFINQPVPFLSGPKQKEAAQHNCEQPQTKEAPSLTLFKKLC